MIEDLRMDWPMAKEVPISEWPVLSVKLHPDTLAFIEARCQKSGRSIEGEATSVIVESAQLAEIPPAATATKFQCSEELMSEKGECKDCGELIWHHARLWAERHVQATGHRVVVSLYLDFRDDNWIENLTPERRAQIDELRSPEVARNVARKLSAGKPH